jgi:hypothetical protein
MPSGQPERLGKRRGQKRVKVICLSLRPLYFARKRSTSRTKMGRICDSAHCGLQVDDGPLLSADPAPRAGNCRGPAAASRSAQQCTFAALPATAPKGKPLAGLGEGLVTGNGEIRNPYN